MGWTIRPPTSSCCRWFPDNSRVPRSIWAGCAGRTGSAARVQWRPVLRGPVVQGCRCAERLRSERRQVTAGTIFHRTRTPMSTSFAAIWFVTSQKNGMSAQACSGSSGSAPTRRRGAWLPSSPSDGPPGPGPALRTVEVDETMVGGGQPRHVRRRHRQGPGDDRGGTQRRPASAAGSGSPSPTAQEASPWSDWATAVIEPGSTVRTDGAPVLRRLADRGFTHQATAAYSAADQSSVLPRRPPGRLAAQTLDDPAPCTTASSSSTCPTTSTNTPSASTGAPPEAAACCSTELLQQAVNTDPHPLHTLIRPGQGSWDDFT